MKMKLIIQSKSSSINLGNTSTEDREKCESARYFYLSFYLAHGGTKKKELVRLYMALNGSLTLNH